MYTKDRKGFTVTLTVVFTAVLLLMVVFVLVNIFGSYCRPARSEVPVRLGLEGVTAFPGDFLSHLVMPFKRHHPGLDVDDVWAQGRGEVSEAKIQ